MSCQWFAAYTQPHSEFHVQEYLSSLGLDCYVPTQRREVVKMGKKRHVTVPAINSIVFPFLEPKTCSSLIKDPSVKLYFIRNRETGVPTPIDEKQMSDFRMLMDHPEMIFKCSTPDLKKGRRVRVKDGPLKGLEGEFTRVAGDRRVVVRLEGIMSLVTTFISPALLEAI